MLKNISIFLFFSILTDSSGSRSGSRPGSRSGSRSSWGFKSGSRSTNSGSYPGSSNGWKPRPSVWDKCSKQNITNGEINCDINRGTGNEKAICPHWKGSPIHDWDVELGQCVLEPPETDCSIIVTNKASTDMHLRVTTEIRSRTSAWENLAEDWRTDTVPAGSELLHFQANQTKEIDFRCKVHEGAILGLLVGSGNRVPWTKDVPGDIIGDLGSNKYFIVTDKDVELKPRDRTPDVLAWLSGKSMKEFSVEGFQSSPKVEPEIYILPEEKLNLLPRNQIKDEVSFRAQYSVVDASFGTVFYRHYGTNRINAKVSNNITEIKPLCGEDADFLHLPAPRNKEENDFWLDLAGPQFKDFRNLWLAISDAETEGTWLNESGSELEWTNWANFDEDRSAHNYWAIKTPNRGPDGIMQNSVVMALSNDGNRKLAGTWIDVPDSSNWDNHVICTYVIYHDK